MDYIVKKTACGEEMQENKLWEREGITPLHQHAPFAPSPPCSLCDCGRSGVKTGVAVIISNLTMIFFQLLLCCVQHNKYYSFWVPTTEHLLFIFNS